MLPYIKMDLPIFDDFLQITGNKCIKKQTFSDKD